MSTFRDPIIYPGEPLPDYTPGGWIRHGDGWIWQEESWGAAA